MLGSRTVFVVAVCVTGVLPANAAFPAPPDAVASSVKDVRVLSPEWMCVVVDPTAEILAVRNARFQAVLEADKAKHDQEKAAGKQPWFYEFSKRYRTLVAQKDYHQPLFARLNEPAYWSVNGRKPVDVTVWPHSVDGFPGWDAAAVPTGEPDLKARVADMAYLKLDAPLQSGSTVEVRGADGRSGTIAFSDAATPCWSLKVNQSTYSATAAKKRGYLGMWLPGIGPVDFSAFEGRPFHVMQFEAGDRWDRGRAVGEPVFSGVIRLRKKFADQDVDREGGSNLTGEDVYELDFSGFAGGTGLYCLQVPRLGRSWPFRVTRDGYGDAFFTMMKGLYHQRCGTALTKPYTNWERPACHLETRRGTYVGEPERWYSLQYRKGGPNERAVGFRDESGQRVATSQFTLISNEKPDAPVLPGVRGGWHDAADYDRRIHHHLGTWDLMAAFEAFPGHFTDAQLHIPESGNGIPDILDEAAWSLEVWRATQIPGGGVSSWIEQKAHPEGVAYGSLQKTFAEDPNPMFAAVPDRASSLAYAAAAANLGRLLVPYAPARAAGFIESAKRGFAWGQDAAHTLRGLKFPIREAREKPLIGKTLSFDEDPELLPEDRARSDGGFAAASLYLATRESRYLAAWEASGMGDRIPAVAHAIHPSMALPFILNEGLPPEDRKALKNLVVSAADKLTEAQADHAYRTLWLAPTDGWFHAMAWGTIHSKVRHVVAAYAATGDPRYRESLEAAADFYLGCNPMGTTMATGLGSVHPVVLQHIHSGVDGIVEPVPGIAPYTFTYGVNLVAFMVIEGGHPSVKDFFSPVAIAFLPDKLGRVEIQKALDAVDTSQPGWEREAGRRGRETIWKHFPIFRRKVVHPMSVVDQNEFTVNETITPLALLFGALTGDGYVPGDAMKFRKPRTSPADVPFYGMP